MKLINLIGKTFILLSIIMMASSYASYEKIGTLRGNANCGTKQQKDICSPTNNRGEATREKYNQIREDCITTTEHICVPGKTSSGATCDNGSATYYCYKASFQCKQKTVNEIKTYYWYQISKWRTQDCGSYKVAGVTGTHESCIKGGNEE